MAKLQLTYNFDTPEQLIAHLQANTGNTTAVTPTTTLVAPVATPVAPAVPAGFAPEAPEPLITTDVDKDGLPWNAEYHSDPKSFNDDGTWRSKRGKSDAAKAARAAFLAKGGAVVAPVMPTMPVMLVAAAMPTMPVAAAILPPPISYEQLITKVTGMMTSGVVDGAAVVAMYAQAGFPDPSVYETNETARRALYNVLLTKQPD